MHVSIELQLGIPCTTSVERLGDPMLSVGELLPTGLPPLLRRLPKTAPLRRAQRAALAGLFISGLCGSLPPRPPHAPCG